MNNGYGICLNEWLEDERIKNELRLLIKISSLTAETGVCFAGNEYFANYFKSNHDTISRQVNKLCKLGYVKIDYKRRGAEIIKREIRLAKISFVERQKSHSTNVENVVDNNTSTNNKESKGAIAPKQTFISPTLEDINTYIKESGLYVDANKFFKYYSASNWKDNRGRAVKNWKLKLITWDKNTDTKNQSKTTLQDLPIEERIIEAERIRQEKIEANMEREYGL